MGTGVLNLKKTHTHTLPGFFGASPCYTKPILHVGMYASITHKEKRKAKAKTWNSKSAGALVW